MTRANQSMGISLVEKIREEILLSRLPPGQKLAIGALGERHACGASPVREALNQLASDGLVVRIDRRGFFVSTISRQEFEDILDNRCFLESEGLRRSIQNGGQDWEERVLVDHFRLNALPRTSEGPDGPIVNRDWEDAHRRFHMSLLSACDSQILLANCEKLNELNDRYRYFSRQCEGPQRDERQRQITDDHTALRDLILSRQTDAAVDLLVRHYRSTGQTIFGDDATELGKPVTAARRLTNSQKEKLT